MRPALRLAIFFIGLVLLFGLGYGVGASVDDGGRTSVDPNTKGHSGEH